MKKVGVISNGERDIGLESAKKTVLWLKEQGVFPVVNEQAAIKIGLLEYAVEINELYSQTDFLIVLGGDGTMLRVAKNAALMDVPLLGINLGTLGYLTDVESGQAFEAITKVLNGSYTVQKRMMLESQIASDDINKGTCLSLNDVCVIHSGFSNMVTIDLYINDEFIDTYRSDGFIVATPTGSTAYNLSAGGSILKPDSEMIALTPICPHMLYARPLVIPANDVVKIVLSHAHNSEGVVVLDGQSHNPFYPGNIVTIKRSEYYTSIIKTENKSFFDILRHKMMRTAK